MTATGSSGPRSTPSDTPAYDSGNIFAKILRGEISAHTVYEDDAAICFMDVMPQSPGHCLVVPKAASRNLLDADPAVLSGIMPLVQCIARAAKAGMNADGISIQQFNEEAGGQTVFHLHIHVIPRYADTPLRRHAGGDAGGMEDNAVLADHAARIKSALSAD